MGGGRAPVLMADHGVHGTAPSESSMLILGGTKTFANQSEFSPKEAILYSIPSLPDWRAGSSSPSPFGGTAADPGFPWPKAPRHVGCLLGFNHGSFSVSRRGHRPSDLVTGRSCSWKYTRSSQQTLSRILASSFPVTNSPPSDFSN